MFQVNNDFGMEFPTHVSPLKLCVKSDGYMYVCFFSGANNYEFSKILKRVCIQN